MLPGDIGLLDSGNDIALQIVGPMKHVIVRLQVIRERPGRVGHACGDFLHPFRKEVPLGRDLLRDAIGQIGNDHSDHGRVERHLFRSFDETAAQQRRFDERCPVKDRFEALTIDLDVFALQEELTNLFAHAIELVNLNRLFTPKVEIDPGHHVLDPHQYLVAHLVRFDVEEGAHAGADGALHRFLVEFGIPGVVPVEVKCVASRQDTEVDHRHPQVRTDEADRRLRPSAFIKRGDERQ